MACGNMRRVRFASAGRPELQLEGVLHHPDAGGTADDHFPLVLLCHPQPATSTMEDPLLRELAARLAASDMLALRFNFRGVGASEGQQTDGRLEPLDIAGAVAYLLQQPGAHAAKLALVGHAFGASMALAYAAHDERVRTVVAISPLAFRINAELGTFERPRLFITGEFDEVAPRHKLEPWIAGLPGQRHLKIVSGARHLMRGYEAVAADAVARYLVRWAMLPAI